MLSAARDGDIEPVGVARQEARTGGREEDGTAEARARDRVPPGGWQPGEADRDGRGAPQGDAHPAEIRRPDVSRFALEPVPGKRGTLVVWNRLMAHTSLANETDEPRLVQYVTMTPARDDAAVEREANVKNCLEKHPPFWALRQKVPGQLDPEPGPPVVLTALGRKLVGIDPW